MFDLQQHLEERRKQVDAGLDLALPSASVRPAVLHQAMRHAVFSGGKRLRPVLALDAAEAVGGRAADALPAALAVELLHTYTLVHDDLPCMDDDDFRRGIPTCHKVFGEANAVLAGDALQTLSFEVLTRCVTAPPYATADLVRELAVSAGSAGVIGGQVEDLGAPVQPDLASVEFIHLHKTADLFRCAVRLGAMAGGARAEELEGLTDFATSLGLAFQITDDLLDDRPAAAGEKPELTCLSVYTPRQAREKAQSLIEAGLGALRGLHRGPTEPLRAVAQYVLERTH